MSTRLNLFLAGAAIVAVATPASAHEDGPHREIIIEEIHAGDYDGTWEGEWQDGETWRGMWNGTYTDAEGRRMEGQYTGVFHGNGRFVTDDGQELWLGDEGGWHAGAGHHGAGHHGMHGRRELGASPDGRLGYTLAEREQWLAECRYVMSDGGYGVYDGYYERRDGNGRVIGGLLGAAAGGFAGNRIADGNRLAGTLIGAGVGAVAGAVIGDAIDGRGRRVDPREMSADEVWAARYCDSYLRRYEMGGGYGYAHLQPVMMVQAVAAPGHGQRGHRHGPDCTTTVREEWVEVEAPTPAPRARRVVPRPAPAPAPSGKVTPID